MTRLSYLVRFLMVSPPLPRLLIGTIAVVSLAAIAVTVVDPARGPATLVALLLLQAFACACGFAVPARRGHFDLVLTQGFSRRTIAAAQWLACAAPGVGGWGTIALAHSVRIGALSPLFDMAAMAALFLVSAIPRAANVALPRFSAAIGWLLMIVGLTFVTPQALAPDVAGAAGSQVQWWRTAVTAAVYPPILIEGTLRGRDTWLALPGVTLGVMALGVAVRFVDRHDIPLEAAQ